MAVPTSITDLSDTAASNFPQDSDSTGSTVASLPRNISAIIKKQFIRGSDVAVAASGSVTLSAEYSYFVVTGSGYNITGFSDAYNGRKVTLKFSGALTLVNSASLILPTGANITTAAGDVYEFVNESTGVWRCFHAPSSQTVNLTPYMQKASNLSDVSNTTTARTNIGAAASGANTDITSLANVTSIAGQGYSPYAMRNRIINGAMAIDQRNAGASQTITAGAALAYTVDRFYAYCTGANVTGQQVSGPIANTYRYQFTGAASVTGVGFGTRLEAVNTADLAGSTSTLQVKLKSSSLTSITWTAYYANTKDAFGTLASPTRTQIATGTFTINSTESTYSAQISVGAAATTGIEIVLTGGALLGSQTLTIGDVQLEFGSVASTFERIPYHRILQGCMRYYQIFGGISNNFGLQGVASAAVQNIGSPIIFPVPMRSNPVVTLPTMTNVNTGGAVAYGPNTLGYFLYAQSTASGFVSSLNNGGGYGNANAEL